MAQRSYAPGKGYARPLPWSYALIGHSHTSTVGELAQAIHTADLVPVVVFGVPQLIAQLMSKPDDLQYRLVVLGPTLTDRDPHMAVEIVRAHSDAAIITLSDHTDLPATMDNEQHLPREIPATAVAQAARALVRHTGEALTVPHSVRTWGPLRLDPATHQVHWDGVEISLTPSQFKVLRALIDAQGKVVTVKELGELIYDQTMATDVDNIRVQILRLRKRLGAASHSASKLLCTVRGVGYRLAVAPESPTRP